MPNDAPVAARPHRENSDARDTWSRPRVEVIPLDCEITAYAPDGDLPLF